MLETIMMIIGFNACLAAGGFSAMFIPLKKWIMFICIGIGGFVFCAYSHYPLNWFFYLVYMFGFIIVHFMLKSKIAREAMRDAINQGLDDEKTYISIDKKGKIKVTYLKTIDGGKAS